MDAESRSESRVSDLWFSGSTVVIRAENKLFKLPGAIWAAKSTVFSDLMVLPASDEGERIDGCLVMRLDESAQDVEVFLRAIFDSSYFMPAPIPVHLWAEVLALLRLSDKYKVQYLYPRALDHLAVDRWYAASYSRGPGSPDFAVSHLIQPEYLLAAFSVIAATIQVEALWLLPSAYYIAATGNSEELLLCAEGNMQPHAQKYLATHAVLVRGAVAVNRYRTAPLHLRRCACVRLGQPL
ncbi:hypothetical protein C8R43DRAFT_1119323 [Mycena crocata]|nr:hypothetical protein C8R43DRAFT_1119323 [Mycena crocata]